MTDIELCTLLIDEFGNWSKSTDQPIHPTSKEILKHWLDAELARPENSMRVYPLVIDRHLYQWFPVNLGYGLEDILSFARFLQDELGVS